MANNYGKRMGDRKEGRQLRGLPAAAKFTPYAMRQRSDACNQYADSVEVTDIEQWLLAKRAEGCKSLGLLHLVAAAYVRTVSMRPGINRFVAGRRIFSRNDIQLVLTVPRGAALDAAPAMVKVFCSPTDTIYDIYRRISDAVDEVQAGSGDSEADKIAATLCRLPRMFLRLAMRILRFLDFHDWLPRSLLDASPFHGSLAISDLGSLGIQPVSHHIYDLGNLPCFLSFGAKRKVWEADGEGRFHERRYVDYRITCDERIVDGYYYASALKCFKYFLKNPQLLELPPERVEDDGN